MLEVGTKSSVIYYLHLCPVLVPPVLCLSQHPWSALQDPLLGGKGTGCPSVLSDHPLLPQSPLTASHLHMVPAAKNSDWSAVITVKDGFQVTQDMRTIFGTIRCIRKPGDLRLL